LLEMLTKDKRENFYKILEEKIKSDPERYKFFAAGAKKMRDNPVFNKVEFLSKVGNEVIGEMGYLQDLVNDKIINIEVVCFKDNSPTFIKDLFLFFELLDSSFLNFEFEVIPQAPTYHLACRAFEKYKFKYIGLKRKSLKLLDGSKYDVTIWEKKGEEGEL